MDRVYGGDKDLYSFHFFLFSSKKIQSGGGDLGRNKCHKIQKIFAVLSQCPRTYYKFFYPNEKYSSFGGYERLKSTNLTAPASSSIHIGAWISTPRETFPPPVRQLNLD